ncbi:MAG TPA: serine protease [Nitrososphaera sp.]|nr:serine protease [Nitrososphaera sp.]
MSRFHRYFLSNIKVRISTMILASLVAPMILNWDYVQAQQQQQLPQQDQSQISQGPTQLNQGIIVDTAKPAVVQVLSYSFGAVSVNDWGIIDSMMEEEFESLEDQDLLDRDDPESVEYWRTALLFQDPVRYIGSTDNIRQIETNSSSSGSGFIVTPDGYIVTNAHVAFPTQEQINSDVIESAIYSLLNSDYEWVNSYVSQQLGITVTEEQMNAYLNALDQYYRQTLALDSSNSFVYVLNRYSIPGVQTGEQPIAAEVLPYASGSPIPGKDVAIIKIEATNLPTLPLGNDTDLRPLDDLIVIGYPGAVSANPILASTGQEPSVITGEFSGYQTTVEGWRAIQVQAPIAHGNSGGPALDSSGRVVGIATFGSIDPSTLQEAPGFNFLVPVSIIKDYLNRANVQPTESQFTTMYRQALTEYSAGNFQQSLNILQQINALSPNNPYILNYISRAQQGAAGPNNFPNPPLPGNNSTTLTR